MANNSCEDSPFVDPATISLGPPSSLVVSAESVPGPETEASSEVERESSELLAAQEQSDDLGVTEGSTLKDEQLATTPATPVKRYVIADSDDDITDEEDNLGRLQESDGKPVFITDHDYAVCYDPNVDKPKTVDDFPIIPGLSELGLVSDDLELPPEQHLPPNRLPASHMGYEQREPNIINRSPASVREGVYRTNDNQSGYMARPARPSIQTQSYRSVPDRGLPHTQQPQHQQQHFFVAGYNGASGARRVVTTAPMSSSPMVQKRTAPRIVSTPSQIRTSGARMSTSAPHLTMQQPPHRQANAVTAAPPVPRQVDPPPHRSFHQGQEPSSHRLLLMPSGAGSRVAFSPADPSQAALANAPAPLIVPGRGTRPIVRGRGGSVSGRAKKESISGVSGEETSPAHSPHTASRLPVTASPQCNRTTAVSPRKQVHFSDGVTVGPGVGGASSPIRMQGMPPTALHPPPLESTAQQVGMRSPPKFATTRPRPIGAPAAPHPGHVPAQEVTSPPRVGHTAPETPPLPENFIDPEAVPQHFDDSEAQKTSTTLPPEVMAAATSLSAEADVNHPQWTNNDISAEEIKAKIEAISREIAQACISDIRFEAQAREKRRALGDSPGSMRRRSGPETVLSGGEEQDSSGSGPGLGPRGRGRPKGSSFLQGRARSSLSSSSTTSSAAAGTPTVHPDGLEGPYGSTRVAGYQSPRTSARTTAARGNANHTTVYDGSMAPELPPPLPPIGNVQSLRGQAPQVPSSHLPSQQQVPMEHISQGYQERGVNGVSPSDDLANVSTDPSSDEDEPAEEAEWGDYVTRCLCEMQHNDEWMVECEQCNVWQHMKCMGLDPRKFNQNDTYLCEFCKPRPLKWTKKQAQELQLKQLKAVSREKERKMAEKLRRREERKRAKLNRRLKERNHAKAVKRGPAAFKKFQMISRNEYTKRAKQMLALFDTTAGAQSILDSSRDLKRGKRMFVAPDIEGLVSTEAIKQDDVIMEYIGHVCLPDECPGRLQRGALQPYCVLYNGLGQNLLCIDARRQGSDARFARRCCRSNSTLKHVLLNGCIYVMLVASERIEKGTEVTIPFDCDFRDTLVPVECACGEDPNCFMKQFNDSLRCKAAYEERPHHDAAQRSQHSNGTTSSGRRIAAQTPQKNKSDNRGRPKGSGKKEKVVEDTPRKKGPVGRKPKKVGIRLRRHSDSKNTKSSDESMEQGTDADTGESKPENVTDEKRETSEVEVASPAPVPTAEDATEVETKVEEEAKVSTEVEEPASPKKQADGPKSPKKADEPKSPKKEAAEADKPGSVSPKKEEQPTSGKRRSSTGSGRFPRREAIELKEVMDYTLPEDRNKPSREERKLAAALAAIERKEEKEKKKAIAHKESGEAKRGPGRPARARSGSTGTSKGGRRISERQAENASKDKKPAESTPKEKRQAESAAKEKRHSESATKEKRQSESTPKTESAPKEKRPAENATKEKKQMESAVKEKKVKEETAEEQPVRESPRGKKKREDSKENEIEVATIAQPPRKRWAAAVKENEAAQRASSPEVTSSSSATSNVDVTSSDSITPSSVGGKKLWLRRHAAESISEESSQNNDVAVSPEPLSCAADSTSDITIPQHQRIQMSPPLKKRRHLLDACQSDEHVAATVLAQMGAKAEGFRFHWNMALRFLTPKFSGVNDDFTLAVIVRKPLPLPTPRPASAPVPVTEPIPAPTATPASVPSVSVEVPEATPTSSQAPMVSPVEVKKAKRITLEDYKKRRSTMGSTENSGSSAGTSSAPTGTGSISDVKTRLGDGPVRPTRSFIPTMDMPLDQNPVLRPLDTSIPIPPLGMPPDLEVVKKMILQESCIPAPPVPPSLPPPPEQPPVSGAVASSSDMSIGSSCSESGEERMSLADRLAKEFGVGTAGTPRQSPKALLSPAALRMMSLRDVPPPPPPPGPRPTRNTRW
ncbi:hypothetical protein Q1695_007842 [Nippostrongylus brasiliensis]|nr:hypothetical protein Q1695_007842 [Nippostrongylus brasiliensis]